MRPLHKRKSIYYGCEVRNRAAIIFWEEKHMRKNLSIDKSYVTYYNGSKKND